jgi:sigma-B regulation protein RsbU (phosphoserine phosphatase)
MPTKILIVDDEADVELLIRQRFRREIREGVFDFRFARNGEEALAAVQAEAGIEVVLTDINMPVMDGLTLLGRLNERPDPPATVIVSAYGDMPNIRAAMNRGAFDFLTKPIDFHDFEVTVQKTLAQVRRLRDAQADHDRLVALQRDLAIAADIQRSFLPSADGGGETVFDVQATMIPAQAVGGDFYDHFALGPGRLGVVIGDVSGKGVPAAILMAVTRSLLRSCALRGGEPGACLEEVNQILVRDTSAERFVTVFYAILDAAHGELRYANAGHNRPLLLHGGGAVDELTGAGLVLGVVPGARYQSKTAPLGSGERLFLYTDGIPEALNPRQEQFSETRLQGLLRETEGADPGKLIDRVVEAVRHFTAGAAQSDDLTALAALYRRPTGSPTEAGR